MGKHILLLTNTKTGETMTYDLETQALDVNDEKIRATIFTNIKRKYDKTFDKIEYIR